MRRHSRVRSGRQSTPHAPVFTIRCHHPPQQQSSVPGGVYEHLEACASLRGLDSFFLFCLTLFSGRKRYDLHDCCTCTLVSSGFNVALVLFVIWHLQPSPKWTALVRPSSTPATLHPGDIWASDLLWECVWGVIVVTTCILAAWSSWRTFLQIESYPDKDPAP
jgi:hypothetical protein